LKKKIGVFKTYESKKTIRKIQKNIIIFKVCKSLHIVCFVFFLMLRRDKMMIYSSYSSYWPCDSRKKYMQFFFTCWGQSFSSFCRRRTILLCVFSIFKVSPPPRPKKKEKKRECVYVRYWNLVSTTWQVTNTVTWIKIEADNIDLTHTEVFLD